MYFAIVSLAFSLIGQLGNTLDKVLHPVCAIPFHLPRDMAVNIQCKRRSRMAQVFLHSLNIVPTHESGYRVGMAQVMEAGRRSADFRYNTLEPVVDRPGRKEVPKRIGKDKIVVNPGTTGHLAHTILLRLLKPEQRKHRGGQREHTAFIVLGRGKIYLPALEVFPSNLLLYKQGAILKVNTVPCQP